jgi:hypothetical protein
MDPPLVVSGNAGFAPFPPIQKSPFTEKSDSTTLASSAGFEAIWSMILSMSVRIIPGLRPVGTVLPQGREDVGDRHDPGAERDLLGVEATGIPAAVQFLVVMGRPL